MADVVIVPQSRVEEILAAAINGEDYEKVPQSRVEYLLIQLKDVIEAGGGGGGGTTNYNGLTNRPKVNGVTLTGDKTGTDYGLLDENDSLTAEQMAALKALIPS